MKIIQLFLLLFTVCLFSQKIEYEISLCGKPQKVILTSKNNKRYSGKIESSFFKRKTNRKIIKNEKINKIVVERLFNKLTILGIIDEKKLTDSAECGDFYLDGDYLKFEIFTDGSRTRNTLYGEVYPVSETGIEINSCRRNAQILVSLIDKELNLKSKFKKQFLKLPINSCYWTGITMVCNGKNGSKSKN